MLLPVFHLVAEAALVVAPLVLKVGLLTPPATEISRVPSLEGIPASLNLSAEFSGKSHLTIVSGAGVTLMYKFSVCMLFPYEFVAVKLTL